MGVRRGEEGGGEMGMGEGRGSGGWGWVHRTASADPQSTALCPVGGAPRGPPLGFPKGPVQDAGKGRGLPLGAGPESLGLPTLNGWFRTQASGGPPSSCPWGASLRRPF